MRFCSIVLTAVALSAGAAGTASADVVVNGGFETGDFTGWTFNGDLVNNFVAGGFVHGGNFAAWFGEIGGLGTLSQTLVTTPGQAYDLSFWFAGDGDSPSQLIASVNGNQLLNLVDPAFDPDYVKYTYSFTATGAATPLVFSFRDDDFFINLDDVSVVAAVPEPSPVVLLGVAGLAALVVSRLRRRPAAA